jgi:glutaredoxin 2
MTMRRTVALLNGIIAILFLASYAAGQETKTVPPDTMKYIVKKQKPDPQSLTDLEKAKAERVAMMQSELQNILKRVSQLPDSLRHEALIDEIQNMRTLREFKASQYEKRLMNSTAAPGKQDEINLHQDRSQKPSEKAKQRESTKDAQNRKSNSDSNR